LGSVCELIRNLCMPYKVCIGHYLLYNCKAHAVVENSETKRRERELKARGERRGRREQRGLEERIAREEGGGREEGRSWREEIREGEEGDVRRLEEVR
jgi:hypothetical protein